MKLLALFEDCRIVEGPVRSVIVDFTRETYHLVPTSLARLLRDFNGRPLEELERTFADQKAVLDEYLDFLHAHELIFFCDSEAELQRFPPLDLSWDYPARITNAVVELDEKSKLVHETIGQIAALNCQYLKLICYGPFSLLRAVVESLAESTIRGLDADLRYEPGIVTQIVQLMRDHPRLLRAQLFEAPKNEIVPVKQEAGAAHSLVLSTAPLSNKNCGQIHHALFSKTIPHFTESQQFNSCLNRKLSVDTKGNIRNCPSLDTVFGNVAETALADVVATEDFQRLWHVDKSRIDVCRVCEFRHICTDCRAYRENPDDLYSKPLKCGYDPYTGEWEPWSEHPMKQAAIAHYRLPAEG